MPERILQIDLGKDARDFVGVSLNDLPILDKSNANDRKLRKALGRLAAQPEREGDRVNFYVCDEAGGRPHDVVCEPAAERELRANKDLKADLELLEQRLTQIENEELRKTLYQHFSDIRSAGPAHQSCHFCKWKTPGGVWRLAWLWGFQRKDLEPAAPVICTNPRCRTLFAKRSADPHCPICVGGEGGEAPVAGRGAGKQAGGLLGGKGLAIGGVCLLLALVALGVGYWFGRGQTPEPPPIPPDGGSPQLAVEPLNWSGPVGGRVEFTVRLGDEDVSKRVVARSDSPRVVRFRGADPVASARAPGKSVVKFHLGDASTQATITVEPPRNPRSVTLEPKELTLGVGATSRLRLLGEYESGQIDLTDSAIWAPADSAAVFVHHGVLEGVAAGETTVRAMYRASPDQPLLDASAAIKVQDEQYESLAVSVDRSDLTVGQATGVSARVVTKQGKELSVDGSSKLTLSLKPSSIGRLEDGVLHATQAGKAVLAAQFGELKAETAVNIAAADGGSLEVSPKTLDLAVGETAMLDVAQVGPSPVQFVSSAPDVVEVHSDGRVIGRSPGDNVAIIVSQGAGQVEVNVDVTRELFRSIAILPDTISVAVDETAAIRLVGTTDDRQMVDLAADQVRAERLPSPDFVDFDLSSLTIRGVKPTQSAPQTLTLRFGDLKATAKIDVIAAPMQLAISPAQNVSLPVGQSRQFQVWASYGGGRRVEVSPDRIKWRLDPASGSGVEFDTRTATATATSADGTPLNVVAGYQDATTDSVTIQPAAAEPKKLVIVADANPLVVGETGRFRAMLVGEDGTSTAADDAEFASTDDAKLRVARESGAYTVMAPGVVSVAARHAAAGDVTQQEFQIIARDQGRLALRPERIQLPVGGRQDLQLVLITDGKEREIPLQGDPGVKFASLNQEAADWRPPALWGKQKTSRPFEIAAAWQGKTATALVEVVEIDPLEGDAELRVAPDHVSLAPGQPFAPKVEQKSPEGAWVEIQPSLVQWTFPVGEVAWTPPSPDLRPMVTLTEQSPDEVELQASYLEGAAKLLLSKTATREPAAASEPDARLVVVREPAGETLRVPNAQRYTIVVETGGERHSAADVEWLPAFESEHVAWNPPVLTARRGGRTQRLRARVGDREIEFDTQIVEAGPPPRNEIPAAGEKPTLVRITSGGRPRVSVPVGGELTDVLVEAQFENGATRDVTRQAQLSVADGGDAPPIAVSTGSVSALRVGVATVNAEFQGVASQSGLEVEVSDSGSVTAIEIDPDPLRLAVGETVRLRAMGFIGQGDERVPVGDVTSTPGLTWESRASDIVRAAGPEVTALTEGAATVVAKLGEATAAVDVVVEPAQSDLEEGVRLEPSSLVIRVGESKSIGGDVALLRGEIDLTSGADATSSQPGIVRVDPDTRSLVGVSPGAAQVAFTAGGQNSVLSVTVEAAAGSTGDSRLVIEPSAGRLRIGQSQRVRVFLVDSEGGRTDRTASAVVESSDPAMISVRGMEVTGRGVGEATITAAVPETEESATATFTVEDAAITDFVVLPQTLRLAPGQQQEFRVESVGPEGRRDISQHADLVVSVGGNKPDAVEINGRNVRGVQPGEAVIDVKLGSTSKQATVTVVDQPWSDLRIEPAEATIAVGEQRPFLVFAKRGGEEQSLTPDDGVQVRLSNTSAARVQSPFTVIGASPGFTSLRVQLNDLRAEAKITVTASDRPEPPADSPVQTPGLRFVPDVLTLQMGTPGASVRVVKVAADGTEEDVDHRTEMKFEGPEDVAAMEWTASGAVFKPLKVGSTRVSADYQGTPTRSPLLVRVVDHVEQPRLEVRPNPVSLALGETLSFSKVQIIPGAGIAPIDTDYRVISSDPSVAAVDGQRTLRAVAPGETTVRVTPADVDPRFQNAAATVPVRVTPGDDSDDAAADSGAAPELVISGPSTTSVGAKAQFAVELLTPGGAKDVTSDGASLVVDRDQSNLVEISPGGIVVGKEPSTVNIKARYKDLISSPVQLQIAPIASRFARLEIEIDDKPLSVGESRSYRLWGHPQGGGDPQDLTSMLGSPASPEAPIVALRPSDGVAEHLPPRVVGRAAGAVEIAAVVGQGADSARSEPVRLEVVSDGGDDLGVLTVQPRSISVRVGQPAPPVRVLARRPGEREPRQVNLPFTSEDDSILKRTGEGFVGAEVGQTRLVAQHNGQTLAVDVAVQGNPFSEVRVGEVTLLANRQFSVDIHILGAAMGDVEYRAVSEGDASPTAWKTAQKTGKQVSATVTSPTLTFGGKDAVYNVYLESRNKSDGETERFPCSFGVTTKAVHP